MASPSPLLNIVLYQPEIPGNTGAVGRTCVALGAKLWLVRPLGFRIDEKTLRRAGLDYWQYLDWEVADHWDDLLERLARDFQKKDQLKKPGTDDVLPEPLETKPCDPQRIWYFSRFGTRSYTDIEYQQGDTFVFGAETSGLPSSLTDPVPDQRLRIPTTDKVRSLNLATSVGITAFEAARQIGMSR